MADMVHEPPPSVAPPHGAGPVVVPAVVPRTIVPPVGLAIAAVVLIGLTVVIATDEFWGVEFFHIAFGGMWTAIDLFVGLILGPILGTMSIPSRLELMRRLMPKLAVILPVIVICTLAAGWQLGQDMGTVYSDYPNHGWIVASYIVVGVMAIIALGVLEPANIAVLFELRKPEPNLMVVGALMKRFIYTAGITGVMQVATLVIMTKIGTG